MSTAEFVALIASIWAQRADVPGHIDRIAALARVQGAPMLSHDDSQTETRSYYRALGAKVAEFPMHERVFLAAKEAGDPIVLGAPNAMRGGSHLGSPGAADMIARGLCDILASDYYYPAMLGAMVRLHADRVAPLPVLWALVSRNPAAAMGRCPARRWVAKHPDAPGDVCARHGTCSRLLLRDWRSATVRPCAIPQFAPAVRMPFDSGQRARPPAMHNLHECISIQQKGPAAWKIRT
jgi:hypothetical protein